MSTVIKLRRDTAANWIENNPVLDVGEPGIETDTRKIKYGDGINPWTTLNYGTTVFPTTIAHATRATNIESGSSNQILYQTNANTTGFLPAPNTNLVKFLQWNGTGFTWSAVAASGLTGSTLPNNITASNLTSLGTLTGLLVAGNVEAYTVGGTLTTPSQPNITTIGTLTGLNVSGAITSETVSGTLQTAAQPNITSVGTLTSLTVGPGTITGTLDTAYQPNITTVGTLINLTVTNTITGSINGSAAVASKANNLSGGNATTLYGSIPYQSALDTSTLLSPNITLTRKFLSETGDGINGAAPEWLALQSADIPNNAADTSGTASKATNLIGGNGTTLLGTVPYQSDTNTTSFVAPNTSLTKKFLRQTGDGTNGAVPAWDTLVSGDIPNNAADTSGNAATSNKSTNLIGGNNNTLLGSIPYQSNTDVTTLLAPNTTVIKKFLNMTGNGTNGAAPNWATVAASDVNLGNVTNESKATMFTSPTFTGTVQLPQGFNSAAPLKFAASSNFLTTAEAGAFETDNNNFYLTANTTNGRAFIPTTHTFQLLAAGTGITATATGTNFFGTNSNIPLVANAVYDFEYVLWFTTVTANARNFSWIYNGTVLGANYIYEMSPITGIVAPPGTATMLAGQTYGSTSATYTVITGSLSTGATFYVKVKGRLYNGTSTSLKLNAWTTTSGTITPQGASYWKITRIPITTSTGEVAA